MKLPDLVKNLRNNALEEHEIEYDDKYAHFLELLADPKRLHGIAVSTILLILDRRPFSLVPMAYALKFSELFDSQIVAMTQKVHSSMLKQEAMKQQTPVTIFEYQSFKFSDVTSLMKKHKPGLIIINHTHELREPIQENLITPVLVVKASQLLQL